MNIYTTTTTNQTKRAKEALNKLVEENARVVEEFLTSVKKSNGTLKGAICPPKDQ